LSRLERTSVLHFSARCHHISRTRTMSDRRGSPPAVSMIDRGVACSDRRRPSVRGCSGSAKRSASTFSAPRPKTALITGFLLPIVLRASVSWRTPLSGQPIHLPCLTSSRSAPRGCSIVPGSTTAGPAMSARCPALRRSVTVCLRPTSSHCQVPSPMPTFCSACLNSIYFHTLLSFLSLDRAGAELALASSLRLPLDAMRRPAASATLRTVFFFFDVSRPCVRCSFQSAESKSTRTKHAMIAFVGGRSLHSFAIAREICPSPR